MDDTIIIGIGEFVVVSDNRKISTLGLGSCIGTVIFDSVSKISGLSHIMLPTIGVAKKEKIGKFADTAIPAMIDDMVKKGASPVRLRAKIAGGASLFMFTDDQLKIGDRNSEAVRKVLAYYKIPIIAADVGGNRGRTITFNPATGE